MYNRFRLQITIRLTLLIMTVIGAFLLWFKTPFYLSTALVLLLVIYQASWFIHYVEQTNRKLGRFLDSIRHSDFSRSFSGPGLGSTFDQLDKSFREVVKAFKKQRIEKQIQFRYMQTVVQHVDIGLVSFNQVGEVELLNTAAKRIFDISGLYNIDDLENISPLLLETFKNIAGGDQDVVRITVGNKILHLALRASDFRLRNECYKLVSFQDIKPELEDKEMESWQNITRVMAHEIMNSVTPIASLSDTVRMLMEANTQEKSDGYTITKDAVKDVSEALDTIETRSKGLVRFVNSYRDFTKAPDPEVERFVVNDMLQRVKNLNRGKAKDQDTNVKTSVHPETLNLLADPHLIEQVLINLIKNAFRALKDQPNGKIMLRGEEAFRGRVRILVSDNGPGIPQDDRDKIFIPFYSTQRPHVMGGSGIGLSLSRQIMRAHGGSLSFKPNQHHKGATFALLF